jgi:acyl transferase domain-containing protein/phosphopantetheinyl transferase
MAQHDTFADPCPDGIAIVGMACVFPQAPGLHAFWRNIVSGVDAVGDAPPAWEAKRYLDSGRIKTSAGGWLRDLFRFDAHKFGIMPNSLDGGEPDQFLALAVAAEALHDAGYLEGRDHRDTGIVLGHSTYLHRGQGTLIQNHIVVDQTIDLLRVMCPELGDDALGEVRKTLSRSLPVCNADIAPGLVPNVMTGRIANRLNLRGPNYLVDAACSSSLLAVGAAIDELRAGRSSLMLAGGVNASLPAEVSVIFTQLGALSGRGKVRPFESGSDGTLLGEGLGVVVLERVSDALRNGARIYAVLRGIGQASDGRGGGLLAPTVEGETLAIRRAYESADVDPASVGLIEAHGTGIPLGDKTEIAALANVFGRHPGTPVTLPIGSVKSMISHCIPAAGIAGLIKTALALHHRVLPPTLCDEVNPELGLEAPLYINTQATPWIQPPGSPRRAGIDSFGFGGINAHAILEEAPAAALRPQHCSPWASELCVFSAPDKAALVQQITAFRDRMNEHPEWTLEQIAAALAAADTGASHRLALVVDDRTALDKAIERASKRLRDTDKARWATRDGAVYCAQPLGGSLAFVFPGEGSQYLGMFSDLAMVFDDVRQWLDFWAGLYEEAPGHRRTDLAFPPPSTLSPQRRRELDARLHEMDVGSEAVFVGAQAMYTLLRRLGVTPDVMLGHSSGESSALAASGAIPWQQPAELGAHIRRLNEVYRGILDDGKIPTGALLAVGALPLDTVKQQIAEVDASIVVAMHNCSNQLVLFGSKASIEALFERLTTAGGICMVLPFDRGYHTPSFAGASAAFRGYYDSIELGRPSVPLYSCASAARFPDDPQGIRDLAASQWSSTVRFQDTVEQMFADGVTTFIEVGPSGNLTSFINGILGGSGYLAIATNVRRRSGLEQVLAVVAHLYAEARPLQLPELFAGRAIATIDLTGATKHVLRGVILDNTMPRIRLGEADVTRLRALVQSQPTTTAAPIAEPGAPIAAQAPVAELAGVMPDYFRLMHAFLDQQSRLVGDWQSLGRSDARPTAAASAGEPAAFTSFLDAIVEHDADHVIAQCRLSVEHDAFLRDHVLSGAVSVRDPALVGLSCVPLMVSLEIMAEACALLAGTPDVCVIENVRANGWIALDEQHVALEVHAQPLDAERGRYAAQLVGPTGVVVSAEFGFELAEVLCPALPPLSEFRSSVWNDEGLYTCGMFHGPLFQSIRHIDGWDDTGIDAQLSPVALRGFFAEGHQPALVLNPVLLDAVGQLAAYWIAQFAGVEFNCFPSTIERIELYARCPEDLPGLALRARQRPLDASSDDVSAPRAWDFECIDANGRPLVRVTNLQNVYFAVPLRFYEVRRDPLQGWLGHPTRLPGREDVLLWELEMLAETFCAQSSGIFLRILAHAFLGADERREWQALTGNVRRRREWLLGRASIKEAVRYWIYQREGVLLHPSDIAVMHDEQGAPWVDGEWRGTLSDAPSVSLSHDAFVCTVALASPVCRVGVDREAIGRIKTPHLVVESLTPTEKLLLEGLDEATLQDRLLRIWCAKEAAAKFLGVGMQGVPAAFEVVFADPANHSARVAHASSSVFVDLVRDDTSIIALASESREGHQ